MIKNALAVVVFAVGAVGCRARAASPPGFQGVVELDERVVAFEVPGRIREVPVKRGDHVKSGDVLARLDDSLERRTREVREGDVGVASADLALLKAGSRREDIEAAAAQVRAALAAEDVLKKTQERVKALHDSGSVPQAELDRADADLARAKAEREALEARLVELKRGTRREDVARAAARKDAAERAVALEDERLDRFTVKSLVDGAVLDVHVRAGELAAPGTPVATLADVTHPYVDVFVPEGTLDGIVVGARSNVRVDGGAASFPGVVEWISPKTEFTPRYLFSERERPNLVVRVRVRVDDPEVRLHAGVPAFVEIARR